MMDFVSKIMDFVLKLINFVLQMMDCVSKTVAENQKDKKLEEEAHVKLVRQLTDTRKCAAADLSSAGMFY